MVPAVAIVAGYQPALGVLLRILRQDIAAGISEAPEAASVRWSQAQASDADRLGSLRLRNSRHVL